MTGARLGSTVITAIRQGSTVINEVRRGSTIVWQRVFIGDDFNRSDAETLGSSWTEYANHTQNPYSLGITNNLARVQIPDDIIGGAFSLSTSLMRYNQTVGSTGEGWVECVPASLGSSKSLASPTGYHTEVYRRLSDSGFSDGVGIRLTEGICYIVSRVSGTVTVRATCGSFQPGDLLRLEELTAYAHKLYRNGEQVGYWTDSGHVVPQRSGYGSLGVRADGAKDALGPRRFSPMLDRVAMG